MTEPKKPVFTITVGDLHSGVPQKIAEIPEKEYDPYQFGNTKHPISYWGAVVHLIRSTIGTGILVLPFAFQNVGYVAAIVGSLIIGLLYVSNMHSLLFTEYHLCKRLRVRSLTFVGLVDKTFELGPNATRKWGPYFKLLLYSYYGLPSGSSIYLIIIADNSTKIFHYFFAEEYSIQTGINVITVPLILLCLIPELKFLVPLSLLTNIFSLVNVGIILVYSLQVDNWSSNAKPVENVQYIPQFFALVLQSFIVTGMILPLKHDMRKPKKFATPFGVLNVSFAALVLLYITFGMVGYLNYGNLVKDNILSNLPEGHYITVSVYILYTLALCVTYTLLFYVYFDTIWSNIVRDKVAGSKHENLYKYSLRISINIVALVMAKAVPNFGLFSAMVGTLGIVTEIALPSLLQLVFLSTYQCRPSLYRYWIVKNSVIILIAAFMFVMSLKTCITDVLKLYG